MVRGDRQWLYSSLLSLVQYIVFHYFVENYERLLNVYIDVIVMMHTLVQYSF